MSILEQCDSYLPFKNNSLSSDNNIVARLFASCAGRTGDLFDIIKWAAIDSLLNNQSGIKLENLSNAFEVEGDSSLITQNPFNVANNDNLQVKILTEQSKWLRENERSRGEKRIKDAIFENFSASEILSLNSKSRKKK